MLVSPQKAGWNQRREAAWSLNGQFESKAISVRESVFNWRIDLKEWETMLLS